MSEARVRQGLTAAGTAGVAVLVAVAYALGSGSGSNAKASPASSSPVTVLEGLDRRLYLACDSAAHIDELVKIANAEGNMSMTATDVAARARSGSTRW